MASVLETPTISPSGTPWTIVDLVDRFGAISVSRICFDPAPGTATVEDAIRISESEDRLVELYDGVLLEKVMGAFESSLASYLNHLLATFVFDRNLGILLGEAGMLELLPEQVRMADIAFLSHKSLEGSGYPEKAAPTVGPDLAIEILSKGNTPKEMDRKLRDYFASGTQLVWYIDPRKKDARVYTSVTDVKELGENDVLDGADVLPGFTLSLAEIFSRSWESKK